MNVVHISGSQIPSNKANSIQVMKVCQAIVQLGHSLKLLVPGDTSHPWDGLATHYGLHTPFDIQWVPSKAHLRRYDFALKSIRVALRSQTHVIYTRLIQAAVAGLLWRVPVILELHELPNSRTGDMLFRLFLWIPGFKRLIPITQALSRDFQSTYPGLPKSAEVVVGPSGVDLERYQDLPIPQAARKRLGLPELPTVGYTGHLYPGKGMEIILELARSRPTVNFLCVGGRTQDVYHWRNRLQTEKIQNITLTGFIDNERIPLYQAAMDIALLPLQPTVQGSSGGNLAAHTSPLKLFEYMAAGCAILSSDLPVIREVLDERMAIFCPPTDFKAWQASLRSMLDDPAKRQALGDRCRQKATAYSWQRRTEKCLAGFAPGSQP